NLSLACFVYGKAPLPYESYGKVKTRSIFGETRPAAEVGREDFFALDFPSGESMPSTESGVSGGGRAHGSATAATQGPSPQAAGTFCFERRARKKRDSKR